LIGEARLDYPENHIESDNRLSWFLGRLEQRYGDDAIYIHLRRETMATANSYANRTSVKAGIMKAYRNGILPRLSDETEDLAVAMDYCDTVDSNIELFMKNKSHKMCFSLENAASDFPKFWSLINAEGDIGPALDEFNTSYNKSKIGPGKLEVVLTSPIRVIKKLVRLFAGLPTYIREA